MHLKICGINKIDDLKICAQYGVDYIGINFCKTSKRYAGNGDILKNIDVVAKNDAKYVAIMKDNSLLECYEIIKLGKFDVLQVYGDYLLNYVQKYKNEYEIWYAISAEKLSSILDIGLFDLLLLDSAKPGSGCVFSDNILDELLEKRCNFGIAGGINASNILEFKNKYIKASVLDLASGVEDAGKFSEEKLKEIYGLFYNNGK